MAKLTTQQRKAIPKSKVGLPEKAKPGPRGGAPRGDYPMQDVKHARNAKARAQQQYEKGNLTEPELIKIENKANRIIRAAGGKAAPASTKRAAQSGKRK